MIPILYNNTETAFETNGIGRLVDAIDCTVTEERNGVYELYMQYPITGAWFSELQHSRIIFAVPADGKKPQPFRVYRIGKPIDGVCSVYAEHISYQLNNIPVMPFTASGVASALEGLGTYAAETNPFVFWTDKGTTGTFAVSQPTAARALLGGVEGSILDTFGGGEYEFDRYQVRLWQDRGINSGATIVYGKNMTNLVNDETLESTITGVCPYWYNEETGTLVTLPEKVLHSTYSARYPYSRTVPLDLSEYWEEAPTVTQLRNRASTWLTNQLGTPKVSIKVEFVPLWAVDGVSLGSPSTTLVIPARVEGDTLVDVNGTVDGDTLVLNDAYFEVTYESYRALERIHLCDTVFVSYPALGVTATAKVIKTVYNVLEDRYDSLEIGEARSTLADTILGIDENVTSEIKSAKSLFRQMMDYQTQLITGGLGGHVVFTLNGEGQPEEILIMDTDDTATAVNVIRMNKAGIGFSTSGYSGPFESAWTIDGVFNARFISAGTMLATRIKGGTLTLGGVNDENGVLEVVDSTGTVISRLDNTGANIAGELVIRIPGYDSGGHVEAKEGSFSVVDRTGFLNRLVSTQTVYGLALQSKQNPYNESIYIVPATAAAEGIGDGSYRTSGGILSTSNLAIASNIDPNGVSNNGYSGINLARGELRVVHYSSSRAGFSISISDSEIYANYRDDNSAYYAFRFRGGTTTTFACSGTKSREVHADEYGDRLLYCYETPTPCFGDIGEGKLDENGVCYIPIDPVFAETITTVRYQVFLQKYGLGECYVTAREPGHFVVCGTPGLCFGWEIKAKQKGFEQLRLDRVQGAGEAPTDYGGLAAAYLNQLQEGRIA